MMTRAGKILESARHGTYDADGKFSPQVVKLGKTSSGKCGLFTNGMLAKSITPDEYDQFLNDKEALRSYVERSGFKLED